MKSYGHYCGLAKALDVVGDRWTLLIVRELLARREARYTDLMHGLPGIATNLLATRLRDMEASGLIARDDAPPPVATAVFRLTERGRALEPVVRALGAWAGPLMGTPTEDEVFRSHWLALPIELYFRDRHPDQPPVRIEVRTGTESETPSLIETMDGAVKVHAGTVAAPDASLAGPPHLIMAVLAGRVSLAAARARGLQFSGRAGAIKRLQFVR